MKIYHTETQEDYDALMIELDGKGITLVDGSSPIGWGIWKLHKKNTCILEDKDNNLELEYDNFGYFQRSYPNIPIIKYTAKQEGHCMTPEQEKEYASMAAAIAQGFDHIPNLSEIPNSSDMVNHPPHYKQGEIEVIDIMRLVLTEEEFRGYCKGNVLKYQFRAPFKGKADEDWKKAKWYYDTLKQEETK